MDENLKWLEEFSKSAAGEKLKNAPIAYFSAEYALTTSLPIFAGGLGVLAGDFLREAQDRDIPIVGVGLYYNDGYETLHKVDEKGYIEAPHVHTNPENYGLQPLADGSDKRIVIDVPIQDRNIKVQAWVWRIDKTRVYLLDANVGENSPDDRKITDHLYVADRQTRLKQEIILGIGGARLLEKLSIKPSVYHMNEGHSTLLAFEVINQEMKAKNIGFEEAREEICRKVVFTNHTLAAAGNEVFSNDLFSLLLGNYASDLGIPMTKMTELGRVQDSNSFSMTLAALNLAGNVNAVSRLHGKYAATLWPNNPMISITNGIHLPSWNAIYDDNSIWQSHLENKRELLAKIKLIAEESWDENTLIIGFARRIVNYKRPLSLFENIERLKTILENKEKPARIVVSGNLHPSDSEDQKVFEELRHIADDGLKGLAVFLPGYDLSMAILMTAGCDIWLNTPIVGFEACGTSGMKAGLNGVLPLSTRDGWMDEVDLYGIGWPLDNDKINESILDTLEQKVIPLFYDKNEQGVPVAWETNMKNTRELIKSRFSATRMLREYIEKFYLPLLQSPGQSNN